MEVLKPFRLSVVADIIENYHFDKPFHLYFAALCKQNKNWGSKDRKIYKNLCYDFFRSGYYLLNLPLKERILRSAESLEQGVDPDEYPKMYPFESMVSERIPFNFWCDNLRKQKPMYMAVRKGALSEVSGFLEAQNIPFVQHGGNCVQVPADSKCDLLTEKGLAWVMDIASQKAAAEIVINKNDKVWDACSGAGGKSLYMLNTASVPFHLTCSDIRFHTLQNLKSRILACGFELPQIELSDLSKGFQLQEKYDRIILDVPCSGSGTWGRTPENITGFSEARISQYSELQKKIFSNVVKHLKPGGTLYYITCSVFTEENESNVSFFLSRYHLDFVKDAYYHNDGPDSDILYLAEFKGH